MLLLFAASMPDLETCRRVESQIVFTSSRFGTIRIGCAREGLWEDGEAFKALHGQGWFGCGFRLEQEGSEAFSMSNDLSTYVWEIREADSVL